MPTWLKLTSDDVKEQIYKLAKKGLTPSQIGVILRDSHGVAQVRFVTGNKILRILKSKGLAPDLPEDLYHLIKKAVAVRKHLERNRKDKDAKFRLILIESRIHRLARYYKTKRVLPPNWKYESSTASALRRSPGRGKAYAGAARGRQAALRAEGKQRRSPATRGDRASVNGVRQGAGGPVQRPGGRRELGPEDVTPSTHAPPAPARNGLLQRRGLAVRRG